MEKTIHNAQVVRFGIFELDLQTGELRKAGLKLKFRGQPFQVLAILLERHGAVVTREELQKRLWPDTFVDVEHNLNTAINKIREALGDSAENPRFVETLPRRGYRFIAPLNGAAATALPLPSTAGVHSDVTGREGTEVNTVLPGEKPQTKRSGLRYAVIAGASVLSAALFAHTLTREVPPPRVTRYVQVTSDGLGKTASYAQELPSPLVSDGSRLYFMEGRFASARLAQVSIIGGETALVAAALRIRRVLDISPTKHALLVLSSDVVQMESPLMILPLPAGSLHRVGDILAHDATWSSDGEIIAYANGHDLFLAKGDGSEPRKLTTVTGTAWWPRWSPDGSALRFTVLDALGQRTLWEASTDSGRLRPLLPGWNNRIDQCCGKWTPDGSYFVFESAGQIWAIREPGGLLKKAQELTQLTTSPLSLAAPLPKADGKKLFAIAVQRRGQLMRYDTQSRRFVPFLSGISVEEADFSKDGQWATYVAFPERTLWRSRVDGSERLQLTLPPMEVILPRWSPDAKHIAFAGQVTGKPTKIYLISADGGTPRPATPGERNEGEPSWSPDGNSLVFAPWYWLEGDDVAIRLLDVRNGQLTTLAGSEGLFSARWSPDGRYIAALTADESQALVLFDLTTHKRVELRKSAAYPNWSRDGSYIYFEDPYAHEPAIYRVRISDRRLEELATLDPHILTWATADKWTALAPDDSPLVLRDTSVEEIYALDWEVPQ